MDTPATPNPADVLLKATYYQVVHTLRGLLPPPITDTQEDEARRDLAAVAHIASLLPATPEEANLATNYVAAGAWALDCLRVARSFPNDTALFLQCTARSASMMRQARGWRSALERTQIARRKRETNPTARDAATTTEQRSLALAADALMQAPPPAAPAPAERTTPNPNPNPIAEAERYALKHRSRAKLIRRLRGMPDKTNIGWLPPEVIHAIVTGTTPILRALDEVPRTPMQRAA
jgi:hypothetical protein